MAQSRKQEVRKTLDKNHAEAAHQFRVRYGKREFVLLLVGRTGVGKSSTVNSMFGYQVAAAGSFEATTKQVEFHKLTLEGVPFVFVDTPGLSETLRI